MKTDFDIARARADTLACDQLIHFNNAGASLPPIQVTEALYDYLRCEERYGGYETAASRSVQLQHFYTALARLLNCAEDEIAYVENATRAWDLAFYSFRFCPGDKILTAVAEYGSNVIAYLQQARRCGVEIVFVPDDEHGQLDVAALQNLIDERVKLISISHIPTGGGLINPAAAVGQVARAAGIPYLLDACQSVGQMPVDVAAIGCDMLSGTGRKYLRGPRGTGFLYISRNWLEKLEPPMLDQHAAELISPTEYRVRRDARKFENWEQYFAGKAALGVAADYAMSYGLSAIHERTQLLAQRLRNGLASLAGVNVHDQGQHRSGIVTFDAASRRPTEIKSALSRRGINVSVSSGSGGLVSYQQRGLEALVRASVHYYNTDEEVDRVLLELGAILN